MTGQKHRGRSRNERQQELAKAFATRLRDARLSMVPALSQQALGNTLGVSFQMVQKYESGACQMTPAQVIVAAEALQLPVSFLLVGFDDSDHPVKLPLTVVDLKRGLLEWQKSMENATDKRLAGLSKHLIESWLLLAKP